MLNQTIRQSTIHSQIPCQSRSAQNSKWPTTIVRIEFICSIYSVKHNCVVTENILISKPHQTNNYCKRCRTEQQQRDKLNLQPINLINNRVNTNIIQILYVWDIKNYENRTDKEVVNRKGSQLKDNHQFFIATQQETCSKILTLNASWHQINIVHCSRI